MSTALERPRLTERQQQVLDTFIHLQSIYGMPPTIRRMQEWLGVSSPNGVMCHFLALERKGFLVRPDRTQGRMVWHLPEQYRLPEVSAGLSTVRIKLPYSEIHLTPEESHQLASQLIRSANEADR